VVRTYDEHDRDRHEHRGDPVNSSISTIDLMPGFVCEVRGVDITQSPDAETAAALRALLAERPVLIFRGQSLSPEQQVEFLGVFGNVLDEMHDGTFHSAVSTTAESLVKPGRLLFHMDNHFMPVPLDALSLYGASVDELSAPTLYVDNRAAYRRLPPQLRETLDDADTVNVSYYFFGQGGDQPSRGVTPDHPKAPRTVHPAIEHHPTTGEPFVYITELHTHHFTGLDPAASNQLLEAVHEVLYVADEMYEHHWQPNDLVVWDNLAVQHARGPVPDGEADPDAAPRSLRRVVVGTIDYEDQMEAATAGA
jgi:taurine dioxygenase